jgi:hypothetical protein
LFFKGGFDLIPHKITLTIDLAAEEGRRSKLPGALPAILHLLSPYASYNKVEHLGYCPYHYCDL